MIAQAVKLDPRNMRLLNNLAQSLVLSRRYAEADNVLATAISLSPTSGLSHAWRLWLKVQWHGDVGRAKTLLASAERVPGLSDDLDLLGLNAYRLSLVERDFAGALRALDADARKTYSSPFCFFPVDLLRSQIHHLAGHADDSRRTAEKARIFLDQEIGKQPDDGRLQSALGIALALLGRNNDALRAARRGVDLTKASKDAWFGLGREFEALLAKHEVKP